ncbi:unnamed protein product [Cunninghamella blakesleeana]
MMITKFSYILLFLSAGIMYTNAAWEDAAKDACEKVDSAFVGKNLVLRHQCKVMCRKEVHLPTFESLEDGTECEVIGFGSKIGACKDGRCQAKE